MLSVSRELAAVSNALDVTTPIVVCVPSFRRPHHLRLTLASLARQRTQRRFAVVVVENDTTGRAAVGVASEVIGLTSLPMLCVIEPRQGNCAAINAAFATAREVFPDAGMFLMIDDDEMASPDWLDLMASAAESSGADIVGGPVIPNFNDPAKDVLGRHPAFCPAYDRSGPVPVIYGSGNCLITRAVFDKMPEPAFDMRFNFLGGGDTDFFVRCRRAGLRFHWVTRAVIEETVPESRTTSRWLLSRGLRIGAINYRVEMKGARTLTLRLRLLLRTAARLPLSVLRALRLAATGQIASIALHPMLVAAGSLLAAAGIEPQPYKASTSAS